LSVSFADQPLIVRQTVLKERIRAGKQRLDEKMNKRNHNVLVELRHSTNTHYRLNLGENNNFEHAVCKNTFCNILGIFSRAWKTLEKAAMLTDPGPITHGNKNRQNRRKGSVAFLVEEDVVEYLSELGVREGESYATRFIRERTSLSIRKDEEGLMELPSWYTRRRIYEK
jgi:hypothetical protein